MASFKTSARAAFTTVATSLDVATKTITTAAIAVDMAHAFMEAELQDQRIGYKLNSGTRVAEQVIQAKQAIAELQVNAANFIKKSSEHAAAYQSASTYIDAIVDEMGIKNMPKIEIA